MTTPNPRGRDPYKSYCPKCGAQFGSAWQKAGLAQHMWKEHGIPGTATFNDQLMTYGPTPVSQLTLGQRIQTCRFFDSRPLNWAFNVLVAFPLAFIATGLVAGAVIWPLGKLLQLDKIPDSGSDVCRPTPHGCE